MAETSTVFSGRGSEDRLVVSRQFSRPGYSDITSVGGSMLSVDFSTPLAGPARSERIKQMSNNHPAFEKSRTTQEILVKVQHSLRRMPGVSSTESNEIISKLQEVGQVISQETSQLVDALMNLTLDQEDTDKAIARMSIEANLTKAKFDDQRQTINNLEDQVNLHREKREQAEADASKIMKDLQQLSVEFESHKNRTEKQEDSPNGHEDTIKALEETIQHLEEQVNNRRSLWVMKHSDPQAVVRAIETLADSVQDNHIAHKTLLAMKQAPAKFDDGPGVQVEGNELSRVYNDFPVSTRPLSAFQPMNRPGTVAPPKFGQLQGGGPPRNPPSYQQDRRVQGSWGSASSGPGRTGQSTNSFFSTSSFSRAASSGSRKGFQPPTVPRYRPNAPEFHPSGFPMGQQPEVPHRPPSSFGHGYGQSRDYYPQTPTSGGRTKYGRLHDAVPLSASEYTGPHSNGALVSRNAVPGPLIHLSERSVAAWHDQVMEFYSIIRVFVEQYANMPDNALSMKTSAAHLWPILIATYHPLSEKEATSYLDLHLKSENSKSCLVTRVIIDYIVNRVWVPGAWTGADTESTYALMDVEKGLERTQGQPSAVRQPLIDQQAAIVDNIMKNEEDSTFYKGKLEEITGTLLTTLQPLLNKFVSPSDAYRDLGRVTENAWELSSKILTSRLTFDFRFPEIGSRFSSQSMLPIWPSMDPLELQAKHWRVAMVTTPVITCRNDTGSNISAHSVAMADVFCMQ